MTSADITLVQTRIVNDTEVTDYAIKLFVKNEFNVAVAKDVIMTKLNLATKKSLLKSMKTKKCLGLKLALSMCS